MPSKARDSILHQFANSENPSVLTNSRALVEGINVPSIDGVAIVDEKGSTVDITQVLGRAVRKYPGKEFSIIIIPTFIESGDIESFMESKGFNKVKKVLMSLASFDDNVLAYYIDEGKSKNIVDWDSIDLNTINFDINNIIEKSNIILSDKMMMLVDYMTLEEFKKMLQEKNIITLKEYFEFYKENNIVGGKKIPSSPKQFYNVNKLFLSRGKRYPFKNRYYTVRELSELPECVVNYQALWSRIAKWDIEKAMTTPITKISKHKFRGKEYTIRELSELPECVVDYSTLHSRIIRKWDVEKAMTTPITKILKYKFRGKEYTIRELSELPECIVDYKMLKRRITDQGWSVEKAMTTPSKYYDGTNDIER